jgi:hypothetical protein
VISFKDWLIQQESSAHTRARHAAALGLMPLATVGSIHGRSTASPSEVKSLSTSTRKTRKSKKKLVKHNEIDVWVNKAEELKKDITALLHKISKEKVQKRLPNSNETDKISNKNGEKEKDRNKHSSISADQQRDRRKRNKRTDADHPAS